MPPNQLRAALIKSKMARKAIRLAAMLATSPIDVEAPPLAASKMFCSPLSTNKTPLDRIYLTGLKEMFLLYVKIEYGPTRRQL